MFYSEDNYNKIVPIQTFGLGDIIWEQTLVHDLAQGKQIEWPTEPQFVEGLNRAYPHIRFVDKNTVPYNYNKRDDYTSGGIRFLPLRFADTICNVPYSDCMKSKYMMYHMDWQQWKRKAMWKRDIEKEQALAQKLNVPERFILVNRYWGSESKFKADININTALPIIEMGTIEGFSLFDWAWIIERATEIHTVSTSIIYILEILELAAPEVHLYVRKPQEQDFRNIIYILQKHKYIQHL